MRELNPDRASQRAYYHRNKEKENFRAREWQKRNIEKVKAMKDKFLENNPSYHQEWRDKNRERVRAIGREWTSSNPDKNRIKSAIRRSTKRGNGGHHTKEDIDRISLQQERKCAYCRIKFNGRSFHIDHIIPLARGGSSFPNNLQLLCRKCNLRKNDHDPIVFAQSMGLLI